MIKYDTIVESIKISSPYYNHITTKDHKKYKNYNKRCLLQSHLKRKRTNKNNNKRYVKKKNINYDLERKVMLAPHGAT